MPVPTTQPVYPPVPGEAVEAVWGDGVSDSVIQRFADKVSLDAGWTNPPEGAHAWTVAEQLMWAWVNGQWRSPIRTYADLKAHNP